MTTSIQERRPFNLRYIISEPGGIHPDDARTTFRTAACNYFYIVRQNGVDRYGPTPDFAARTDLVACGRQTPNPRKTVVSDGVAFWHSADDAADRHRPDLSTAMHAVGSLPADGDLRSWKLVIDTVCDELTARGMVVDWAIHAQPNDGAGGKIKPHVHLLLGSRTWRDGSTFGHHNPAWLTKRADVERLKARWYALTGMFPSDYHPPASL